MNHKLLITVAITMLAFGGFPSISFAKNSDFEQSVNVTANKFGGSLDDKTLIYSGNVSVSQGTLLIKADKLVIDSSAGKGKEVFIASGEPAVYS